MPIPGVRLCEPAFTLDADCKRLYEEAFPPGEREPVDRLTVLIADGKMLYHRTLSEQGELICFTLVSLADNFSFLAYMATNPAKRGGGIGSKHLARLLEVLKSLYPRHLGLFFEIEATSPSVEVLDEQTRINRERRRSFYVRAGARVLCEDSIYLTPHFSDRNKEWEGELLAFEFGAPVCSEGLAKVLKQIYCRFYQLPPNHPLVIKVLRNFEDCSECQDEPLADSEQERQACACCIHERSWWSWLFRVISKPIIWLRKILNF